ncbi:DUF881 domain-containing protein [Maledivibacter halophilus]|uniref:Uncharacterized conserved protein YlxW, UPF0749 family n=1 Tax=Maledivibacter halophilus TaxID=36842 RepID=A0A1T5LSB1_9FIRM|nr:DUF881 domain-containing protein [Maledivibacter halophilus]SKC78810.1 Uncharacterized conserved protein YlxW, UPF0749 family [Maledivibacter halophilus]
MKKSYSRLNIIILTIILGLLISLLIRSIEEKNVHVSLEEVRDYKQSLENEKAEIENLKSVISATKDKINNFNMTKIKDGDITKLLQEEVNEYKTLAGSTDVYGPGVIVIIDDASRELYEGENPNNVLVHNIDVLNIVNDLKAAGAEAISINNQRIISSTEIDCSGYTIEINGVDYGHPFIIKAIGEPAHLEAAINAPMAYGHDLRLVYGIFIEVNPSAYIKIPKYEGSILYKYTKSEK